MTAMSSRIKGLPDTYRKSPRPASGETLSWFSAAVQSLGSGGPKPESFRDFHPLQGTSKEMACPSFVV